MNPYGDVRADYRQPYPPAYNQPPVYDQPPGGNPPPGYPGAPQYYQGGYPPPGNLDQSYPNDGVVKMIYIRENRSVETNCPYCHSYMITHVKSEIGTSAWIMFIILFIFCPPFCIYALLCEPFKDVRHFCSVCGKLIAVNTMFS